MSIDSEEPVVGVHSAVVSRVVDEQWSRGSLFGAAVRWPLPRKISLASAAFFAHLAAWVPETAQPGNWQCCNLAEAL